MWDRIFIIRKFRPKIIDNKFSENVLSWLSNFCHVLVFDLTTEIFEG